MEPYAGGVSAETEKIALKYNYGDNFSSRFVSMPYTFQNLTTRPPNDSV